MIPDEAQRAAEVAYRETLTELRLAEGGGFKVASQNRRALHAALEAAAPHMLADILKDAANTAETDELTTAAEVIYDLRRHAKDLRPTDAR